MQQLATQVAILGAGPAGLMLGQLLATRGIESVIVEIRSREHIEQRIRAGVLEQGTVDALDEVGASARLHRQAQVHEGVILRFGGASHRIDLRALTGKAVTIYGQHELVRDLVAARLAAGAPLLFECGDVALADVTERRPRVTFTHGGQPVELRCDFVAGCDGFHGISRGSIPGLTAFEHEYPYGWLGILADVAPSSAELVYAHHYERGFALLSMRSPEVSRLYLQCAADEDLAAWPDTRIWDELAVRLAAGGFHLATGPITQRSVTSMRIFVADSMRHGNLLLAGDAAHIMPPTGAKGLNLAVADARLLADALTAHYRDGDARELERYPEVCKRRVWRVVRFSARMTHLLHRMEPRQLIARRDARRGAGPGSAEREGAGMPPLIGGDRQRRLQISQLEELRTSLDAQRTFAEHYVGLPLREPGDP